MAVYQCSEMFSRVPFVVILGATGSGKSKLAIELARKFGGEIVSADSMQVYKGLDIITNKVTPEERAMAPHHLLEVVTPLEPFSVVDFRDAALPIIDRLIAEKKMPIVVGGTNYYIESLLWKVLVSSEDSRKRPPAEDTDHEQDDDLTDLIVKRPRGVSEPATLRDVPSAELHQRLRDVDPDMAQRLHPNNRRKIIRSLQVYAQLGRTMSSVLKEQRSVEGGSSLGGPLRYPHSLILWIQCDKEVLDRRLDDRVDEMLERGLVDELQTFHEEYNACRPEADYTEGIFQSIGFKEFHEYLVLDAASRASEQGRQLLNKGVAALKMVTRRYARKQLRWVNNRFLRRPDRQVPPVYALDATDVQQWDKLVYEPAVSIVESFISGTESTYKPLPEEAAIENEETSNFCEVCGRTFVGTLQWTIHLASKKHKRMLNKTQTDKSVKPQEDKCEPKPRVQSDVENEIVVPTAREESEKCASRQESL